MPDKLQLYLILLLAFVLPLTSNAEVITAASQRTTITASDNQMLSIDFELTDISNQQLVLEGETFDRYAISGEGMTCESGKPILPAVVRFVVVPPEAGIELIFRSDEPRRLTADHPPLVFSEDMSVERLHRESSSLQELYPPEIAEISDPVVMRGIRLVKVTTYPIQYDPTSNTYLHRDRIETELRFTDDPEAVNPVAVPARRNRSREFIKVIRALAVNGDEVGRDDPDRDAEPAYLGHYLIVTHVNCLEYAAPFIEWRRKAGYKVDILNLTSGQAGNENTVKNAIQQRYDAYLDDGIDPFDQILLIGDRTRYYYSQAAQWILKPYRGNPTWGNDDHADYLFACLDGNDHTPDVGISRWHSGSAGLMELAVGRTLAYEAEPYMDDTSWFTRGAAYSQHWGNSETSAWHIGIHTNVRWAEEVLQHKGFTEVGFYEYYPWDQPGARIGPVIQDWLNEGLNVMLGRAENYYWRQGFTGVNDNVVFPINICASGHGEWCAESMTRTGDGDHLKGPVAMTYGWGNPQYTAPITASWLECVNGVMIQDMTLGWGRVYGITAAETYFGGGQGYILSNKTEFDCFGDPGIQPWIGVPRLVEAEVLGDVAEKTSTVEVFVHLPSVDTPVGGAQITLYAPGDMPDEDDNGYADYDEMFMMTTISNAEGIARFILDEDAEFVGGTPLFVTITGRDIRPFFIEMEIEEPDLLVDIGEVWLSQEEGNDDDDVNPGEVFSLELTVANLGSDDIENDVMAVVSSLSAYVEVESDTVVFDPIPSGNISEGVGEVIVQISPACPDGASRPVTKPVLLVEFFSDDDEFRSGIELNVVSPNLEFESVVGDGIIGTQEENLDVELENVGGQDIEAFTVVLIGLSDYIIVAREAAAYPAIRSDGSSGIDGDRFRVEAEEQSIPGSRTDMLLIITTEDGFVDTAYFDLQLREPARNCPQGPDEYGYVCYDDTDDDWDLTLDYDWFEISLRERDREVDGTLIEFEGDSPHDIGEAAVLDLGFPTQFYGHVYSQITVTTNGFICLGAQPRVTNYQNWPMDRAVGGGAGMIAPLWDDLRLSGGNAGIYYYHDVPGHRFIVEWYKLRHASGGNTDLTFEVIIYDKRYWVSETMDPNVIVQYQSVSDVRNTRGGDTEWTTATPYASVGISSPDGGGINYSYNNRMPVTSAPIANRRALLFATSAMGFRAGFLYGHVTDVATGEPIENARVFTDYDFEMETNEDGYWEFHEALAEQPYEITVTFPEYNDSALVDQWLGDRDTLEITFGLLHPEFLPSTREISVMIDPDWVIERQFSIQNTGNGLLEWSLMRRLPDRAEAEPWERRLTYAVTDTVGDTRLEGVVFIDGRFYVAGANIVGREDSTNMIYVLDQEGSLVNRFPQLGEGNYGMRDIAWDGELIWGSSDIKIYGFTTEGDSVTSFDGPYSPNSAITWDPDREVLWVGRKTGNWLHALDREGNEQEDLRLNQSRLRIYGLTYWQDDPDEYTLYLLCSPDNQTQTIYKMNPDNSDTMFVTVIEPEGRGAPGGAMITNRFDVYSWVFLNIVNDPDGDRIDLWQLQAKKDWFRVFTGEGDNRTEPSTGIIEAGQTQDFSLILNSQELDTVLFEGFLYFNHNAHGFETVIDVSLDVIGPIPPASFDLLTPEDGDTLNANIDTTVVNFCWETPVEHNNHDTLRYLAWFDVDTCSRMLEVVDTSLTIDILALLDSLSLSVEYAYPLEWWVQVISADDTVDCNRSFSLNFLPNALLANDPNVPVEFGLHAIYPSPFNSMTTVRFGIDRVDRTTLMVFDLTGRLVTTLFDRSSVVGNHNLVWNASELPSGLYILRLQSGNRMEVKKVALIR